MPSFFHLKTVAAPDPGATVTVIDFDAPGTKEMAEPDSAAGDLYCGQCGALLVTGMPRRNVRNSLIRCKLCRAFNDPSSITARRGKLTVMRSATFGKKLVLDVYLDGKRVGQLQRGKSYTTSLPTGTHKVKVQTSTQKPMNKATKQVTIEAGKDSTVTASWKGQQLVLR